MIIYNFVKDEGANNAIKNGELDSSIVSTLMNVIVKRRT